MVTASFEFPDGETAKKAFDTLMKKNLATGEIELKRLESGKWIIKIFAEKDIRDSTIEKLGGHKLD